MFFLSFLYKTLVKNSLPTKPLLQLIYTQNDISFAVVLTLVSCLQTGKSGSFGKYSF